MVDHAFQTTYANQPFVRYTGQQMPTIKQVVGTNYCDLGVMYNEATHTIMVASVIDNLVKGAGGQAIQNFNQMNGFDEADGLPTDVLLP
jgi:N-acetyl-gamma-glutamyl-phosphate reductase